MDATLPAARARIDDTLRPWLSAGTSVALVGFPNHRNVGDTLIWLGELAALDRLGVRVAYTCTPTTFSWRAMRRAIGDGPVLINGGGNLGDLYDGPTSQQAMRLRVLATCRNQPVIQLPQSIHFADPANVERTARLVRDHGDVTMLCREASSLALAEASLGAARTAFCPDMALALPSLVRPVEADVDVVWLARRDGESRHALPAELVGLGLDDGTPATVTTGDGRTVHRTDWLEPLPGEHPWPDGAERPYHRNVRLVDALGRSPLLATYAWPRLARTFTPLAEAWVARGARILGRGRVVVTDRLHAHVVALLLGIPSVVLDNSYGKVHGVLDASTATSPLTHRATDPDHAWAMARRLLDQASADPSSTSGQG